jgi:5S rRNA maturation endonuclease (ribonuclease M5)
LRVYKGEAGGSLGREAAIQLSLSKTSGVVILVKTDSTGAAQKKHIMEKIRGTQTKFVNVADSILVNT